MASSSSRPRNRKTEPVKTRDNAQPPAIRGEKRVKQTNATVPVAPARRRRGTHDGPTDPAALDRRKQFTGTDEPADPKRGKTSSRKGGGNAGRAAVGLPGRV
jgi:hypothetical protein